MKRIAALLLVIFALSGCSSVYFDNVQMDPQNKPVATQLTGKQRQTISELKQALLSMSPQVSEQEASVIAYEGVVYSMVLANKYQLTSPPLWHNMMVNSKTRPRGLCYHWQRDLIKHFKQKRFKTVDFVEAVAHEGSYWLEHNTMVVTAVGQNFTNGIAIDPWRSSGEMTWARVNSDKYPWKLRTWAPNEVKQQ